MSNKKKIIYNILLTLFFIAMILVNGPNLNPLYPDAAFLWCFILSCYVVLNFFFATGGLHITFDEFRRIKFDMDKTTRMAKRGIIAIGVIWVIYFAVTILSLPFFNYKAYRNQLGTAVNSEFTDTVQPLHIDQLPIVDKELAAELADKKVGENPSLGSQVVLGTPVVQNVNDKLVWVVPLEHSGFFKWLKNMDGSAGYIIVSATDLNDVRLVSDHKIKYQSNAYIFDDLNRHIRFFNSGLFKALTDYSFELDEDGNPYWVVTVYKNTWLFSLPEAESVILVNASSGASSEYALNNLPTWVDRVQPENFIMNQINNNGVYIHGWWNFSNQDKYQTSDGHIIVFNGSDCYLFTGLTSVGSDQSAIGFDMVNMKTKEVKRYQMNGATEYAAMLSAQGKVQQYGYQASFPMILNIDGKATYFMTLKDNSGLLKQYAFVSVVSYTNVGTGETVASALKDYRNVLNTTGDSIVTGEQEIEVSGTILRIAGETGNTSGTGITYKIILEEHPELLFSVSYDISQELAITNPGDRIKLSYMPSQANYGLSMVTAFDNLEFTQSAK